MLKLVRRSTFETNSSSCHSVVLLAKDLPKTKSNSKEIILSLDEFGWGTDIVTDEGTKLDYLFTCVVNYGSDSDKSCFIKKLGEYYPELTTLRTPEGTMSFEEFSEALMEDRFANSEKYSYIDHESIGVARNTLVTMSFSDYLSDKCTLYITNDNYGTVYLDESLAKSFGITEELADEIIARGSSSYRNPQRYEFTYEMEKVITELGGVVIS